MTEQLLRRRQEEAHIIELVQQKKRTHSLLLRHYKLTMAPQFQQTGYVKTKNQIKPKITRARTSYNFFFHEERKRLQEMILRETGRRPEYPQISKMVAAQWKKIPASEKAYYESLAAEDKRRYGLELVGLSKQSQEVPHDPSMAAARYDHSSTKSHINQADDINESIRNAESSMMTQTQNNMHQYTDLQYMQQQQGKPTLQENIEGTVLPFSMGNAGCSTASATDYHDNQVHGHPDTVTPEKLQGLLVQLLRQPGAPEMLASLLAQHPAVHQRQEPIALPTLPERHNHGHPADHAWIPNEMLDDDVVDVLEEAFGMRRS